MARPLNHLCGGLLAGLLSATAAHADTGGSLWRTPDQRGDAELRAGHPAAAARIYTDPRRKAWAQLQAGDYRAAADTYASLSVPEAAYNRGNALARAGALQQALQAYDDALALNPEDRDARRNRDLMAQALQQARWTQTSRRTPAPATQNAGPAPAPQPASGSAHSRAARPATGAAAPERGAPLPPWPPAPPVSTTGTPPGSPPANREAGRNPTPGASPLRADAPADPRTDTPPADSAVQAERDVLGATRSRSGLRADQDHAPPRTEQQLAEAQWLRRLPDDASGLLRRKFLIQHLIRQGSAP